MHTTHAGIFSQNSMRAVQAILDKSTLYGM
jgi:hypothetical protein